MTIEEFFSKLTELNDIMKGTKTLWAEMWEKQKKQEEIDEILLPLGYYTQLVEDFYTILPCVKVNGE